MQAHQQPLTLSREIAKQHAEPLAISSANLRPPTKRNPVSIFVTISVSHLSPFKSTTSWHQPWSTCKRLMLLSKWTSSQISIDLTTSDTDNRTTTSAQQVASLSVANLPSLPLALLHPSLTASLTPASVRTNSLTAIIYPITHQCLESNTSIWSTIWKESTIWFCNTTVSYHWSNKTSEDSWRMAK